MPILFVSLGLLFVSSVFLSQSLFRASWISEREQIAVDNAGILTGRADRKALNELRSGNQILRSLEMAHHPLHVCANSGTPAAAQCKVSDQALELKIRVTEKQIHLSAQKSWVQGKAEALAEGRRLDNHSLIMSRPAFPPAEETSCSICSLIIGWELVGEIPIRYQIKALSFSQRRTQVEVLLDGRSLQGSKAWNYELKPGEASSPVTNAE